MAQWDGHHFVFPADEVRGVHRFQTPELTEPPATLAKIKLAYTKGILSWQGRAVGLLDAELLFSSLNRSLTVTQPNPDAGQSADAGTLPRRG